MIYFLSLKFVLILANSADPYEMQHYATFHLGLHFLQKHSFKGLQNLGLKCTIPGLQINTNMGLKIVRIFLPISLNICFGCSKELSH